MTEYEEYQRKFDNEFFVEEKVEIDFYINLDTFVPGLTEKSRLVFSAHGCAGTSGKRQKEIADYIKDEESISFNFLLGDNVYDCGIQNESDIDSNLQDLFFSFYGTEKLYFCILGNHDHNFSSSQKSASRLRPTTSFLM